MVVGWHCGSVSGSVAATPVYLQCLSSGAHSKVPKTGGLEPQTFVSHSSGVWEVPDQGQESALSGEDYLPGLQMATCSLCPHMVQRDRFLVSPPLPIRTMTLSDQDPTSMTSFNLKYLLKAPCPKAVTLGVRLQHVNFRVGVRGNSIHNAVSVYLPSNKHFLRACSHAGHCTGVIQRAQK